MVHPTRRRNQLRIIGGEWRGRRLIIAGTLGLRPTPDRVRETLFNWLAPVIEGSRCLDLFAGSGALGFEALSRGAGKVVMVERHHKAVQQLRANAGTLGATGVEIIEADARQFLDGEPQVFDIVFLDPPYGKGLTVACADKLEEYGWLAPESCIYLETGADEALDGLPETWDLAKSKRAGRVNFHLALRYLPG
jgi:16S rRNA (guanine966-N2)-methyltransferase